MYKTYDTNEEKYICICHISCIWEMNYTFAEQLLVFSQLKQFISVDGISITHMSHMMQKLA